MVKGTTGTVTLDIKAKLNYRVMTAKHALLVLFQRESSSEAMKIINGKVVSNFEKYFRLEKSK